MKLFKSWFIFFFLLNTSSSFAQFPQMDMKEMFRKVNDPAVSDIRMMYEFIDHFGEGTDTVAMRDFFYRGQKEVSGKNESSAQKMMLLNIWSWRGFRSGDNLERAQPLLDQYLKAAYASGNERRIGIASWIYGIFMYYYQQLELATTYCLKGIETVEKEDKPVKIADCYSLMGEILFRTREYKLCIYYTLRSSASITDSSFLSIKTDGKNMNTVGQAYYQLGQVDSALYYYKLSDQKFEKIQYELWKGINACFAGQAYFDKKEYSLAKSLLQYAYKTNVGNEDAIAAYALSWLGRIYIIENKQDSAKYYLDRSLSLFRSIKPAQELQAANYRQQAYFAKAELFRTTNQTDSFYFYNRQYSQLHDSVERMATLSNSKIAQLRISDEKNQFAIKTVQAEKSKELLTRNFIIIAISFLAIVVIIILRRQKKELQYKEQLSQFQQKILETEADASKQQLGFFTQNLLEKNNLLEQLQEQLSAKEFNQSQEQAIHVINELINQTILTEDDWTRFKNLFEKNYPGFFTKLKQAVPDITIAEQRMASLTKLELSGKQMASMLGISVDSVYKSRQRLRQRINMKAEDSLEDFIAAI